MECGECCSSSCFDKTIGYMMKSTVGMVEGPWTSMEFGWVDGRGTVPVAVRQKKANAILERL